ncbi:MAG TPA: glycosyltransferase family 1 protein [Actinomycetota bacterium]|nr:glycosyltransferase family 1 protein [Actinomycetota bacterium]
MTATPPDREPAAAPEERGPRLGGPRAGVVAEQLLRPVPGGVGRYVRALASHLPVEATVDRGAVEFLVARHPPDRLAAVGLPLASTRRLSWPGRLVTRTWVTVRRPALPSGLLDRLDLVHATSAAVPPTGRRPLVATVHDLAFRHFPEAYPAAGRRYHERSARIVADEAARVLVPSEATARDLAELYGVDRGRVRITPLGVEVPAEPDHAGAERLLRDLGVRGRFLLAVGTLEPRKNLPRLLGAFGQVSGELPEHWLVVVGPVGWGPRLRPTWDSVRVKLAGPVGDSLLHALYQVADGLAYPSLYEGFGLPVLEAMANGVPVLTSDRSSLPEVAGGAALLVDPLDRDAIAAGLVRLAGDEDLRRRLVEAGRRRAAGFTWRATAAATWTTYREVAERAR